MDKKLNLILLGIDLKDNKLVIKELCEQHGNILYMRWICLNIINIPQQSLSTLWFPEHVPSDARIIVALLMANVTFGSNMQKFTIMLGQVDGSTIMGAKSTILVD